MPKDPSSKNQRNNNSSEYSLRIKSKFKHKAETKSQTRVQAKSLPALPSQQVVHQVPKQIVVDPRQKDVSLEMAMYYSPTRNQLQVKSAEARPAGYYSQLFKLLVANRDKAEKNGLVDINANQIASAAQRIFNSEWLDDICIHDYISFLCSKTDGKIATLNSGFLPNGQIGPVFCDALKAGGSRQNERNTFKNADYIICPIHDRDHWSLMVLIKGAENENAVHYSMYCLDSLNQEQAHAGFFNSGKELLKSICDNKTLKITGVKSYRVPEQHNADDCGVALCYYVERLHHLFLTRQYKSIQSGDYFFNVYREYADAKCNYSQFRHQILKSFHTWNCIRKARAACSSEKVRSLYFQHGVQKSVTHTKEPTCVIDLTASVGETDVSLGDLSPLDVTSKTPKLRNK